MQIWKPEVTSGLTGMIQKTQRKTTEGQCGSEQGEGLMCPRAPPTANFGANLKKATRHTANADPTYQALRKTYDLKGPFSIEKSSSSKDLLHLKKQTQNGLGTCQYHP